MIWRQVVELAPRRTKCCLSSRIFRKLKKLKSLGCCWWLLSCFVPNWCQLQAEEWPAAVEARETLDCPRLKCPFWTSKVALQLWQKTQVTGDGGYGDARSFAAAGFLCNFVGLVQLRGSPFTPMITVFWASEKRIHIMQPAFAAWCLGNHYLDNCHNMSQLSVYFASKVCDSPGPSFTGTASSSSASVAPDKAAPGRSQT